MSQRMRVIVTHGANCDHSADSWSHALSMALDHSGKYMNPQSRMPFVKILMRGEVAWHDGVRFEGRIVK